MNQQSKYDKLKQLAENSKDIINKSEKFNCEEQETKFLCNKLKDFKQDLESYSNDDDVSEKLEDVKEQLDYIHKMYLQLNKDINDIICIVQGKANFVLNENV